MPDTLKRLFGPSALGTTSAVKYTVPTSTFAVMRNIHVCNETSSVASFTLSIGTDGAGKRLFKSLDIPANGAYDWSGSIVLSASEVITALASTASAITLCISGIEVTT